MNHNRRTFIKTISGLVAGVVAAFVPGKAKADFSKGWLEQQSEAKTRTPEQRKYNPRITFFRGYKFVGYKNIISWEKIGGLGGDGTLLPTFDRIQYFNNRRGQLFWVGERETWEIQHLGLKDTEFQFALIQTRQNDSNICYCPKPGNHVSCNYPKCPDYNPGNKKPYKDEYE